MPVANRFNDDITRVRNYSIGDYTEIGAETIQPSYQLLTYFRSSSFVAFFSSRARLHRATPGLDRDHQLADRQPSRAAEWVVTEEACTEESPSASATPSAAPAAAAAAAAARSRPGEVNFEKMTAVNANGKLTEWEYPEDAEMELAVGPDLRDRRLTKAPCGGHHLKFYQGGNQYGMWRHCYRCGIRLQYVPKKGQVIRELHCPHPRMVESALELLQKADLWETGTHHQMESLIEVSGSMPRIPGSPISWSSTQILELLAGTGTTRREPQQRKAGSKTPTEP